MRFLSILVDICLYLSVRASYAPDVLTQVIAQPIVNTMAWPISTPLPYCQLISIHFYITWFIIRIYKYHYNMRECTTVKTQRMHHHRMQHWAACMPFSLTIPTARHLPGAHVFILESKSPCVVLFKHFLAYTAKQFAKITK